jgi:hypothetical protein
MPQFRAEIGSGFDKTASDPEKIFSTDLHGAQADVNRYWEEF